MVKKRPNSIFEKQKGLRFELNSSASISTYLFQQKPSAKLKLKLTTQLDIFFLFQKNQPWHLVVDYLLRNGRSRRRSLQLVANEEFFKENETAD